MSTEPLTQELDIGGGHVFSLKLSHSSKEGVTSSRKIGIKNLDLLQVGDNGAAGAEKYALEEMQRAEKRERQRRKLAWTPRWFRPATDAAVIEGEATPEVRSRQVSVQHLALPLPCNEPVVL